MVLAKVSGKFENDQELFHCLIRLFLHREKMAETGMGVDHVHRALESLETGAIKCFD
jgi:hypothetical protein